MSAEAPRTKAEALVSVSESPAHLRQMKAWDADHETFAALKADIDEELRRLRNELYQVATLYAAFQSVVFTAVAQSNRLSCALWWCPVFISLAISLATFLLLADRLYCIGDVKQDIFEVEGNIAALTKSVDEMERLGSSLDLETAQAVQTNKRDEMGGYRSVCSCHGMSVLAFLVIFSILLAIFCKQALCLHCKVCL